MREGVSTGREEGQGTDRDGGDKVTGHASRGDVSGQVAGTVDFGDFRKVPLDCVSEDP